MFNTSDPRKDVFVPSDITDKAKVALGNGRGTLLLAIFGIAISVSATFMFCLASIGFDFTQLRESTFWSRWASMAVTSLIGYFLVILHKDEKNRMIPWYTDNLQKLCARAVEVGEDFDTFLRGYNEQRRIAAHKRKISEKIAKLQQKALSLDLRGKNKHAVECRIARYRERLTDEYIAKNKDALLAHTKPISAVEVLSETRRGDRDEENFRSSGGFYAYKGITKVVMSLVMTAAFASVVVQNFGAGISVASVVMTIFSVLSTVISVFSAIMAANECYRNVYVPNMLLRLKIMNDFDAWKKGKNLGANWGQTSAPPQKTAVFEEK